jgi:hypothetical protein
VLRALLELCLERGAITAEEYRARLGKP